MLGKIAIMKFASQITYGIPFCNFLFLGVHFGPPEVDFGSLRLDFQHLQVDFGHEGVDFWALLSPCLGHSAQYQFWGSGVDFGSLVFDFKPLVHNF